MRRLWQKQAKKKQEITRIKIIETAINLMIQKGYEKTTMREIARLSEIGDTTIYNYFTSKEKIIWGYIALRISQANSKLSTIKNFHEFSLQEKLHIYFEIILNGYLPDREFLPIAFKMTHQSFLTHHSELKEINSLFLNQVKEFLSESINKKEIPDQPIDSIIPHIILDIYFIVILYWTKDETNDFEQTTEFIDLLLTLFIAIIQQEIITKVVGLGNFLIRQHLFSHINNILDNTTVQSLKKEFKKFTS